jgi:hypothetical protein
LIAVARMLGAKEIYSIDEELSKVREASMRNPFPEDKLKEYHAQLVRKRGRISRKGPQQIARKD